MHTIFQFVANALQSMAVFTGLTYNEVNIIVYYIIVPFTWTILLDKIFKGHYIKILFVLFLVISLLVIRDFKKFSDRLFDKSAHFINFFGDYIVYSVIICVFAVIFIYLVLIYFAFIHKKGK